MTEYKPPKSATKVLEIFEEGKRFTEELLKENEKLRLMVGNFRNEKSELENQYVKIDVPRMQQKIRLLEEDILGLREENRELRSQFSAAEEENHEFADRYVQVERQNTDLVNLYVASYRLHSTLDYSEVIQIIKEIVINLIGSEQFGIYVVDNAERQLIMIGHEGLDQDAQEAVPIAEGVLGETARSGDLYTVPSGEETRATGEPIACVPLKVGERVLGVIAIYQLLVQKDGFKSVDFDLFELLGGHAATAIYVSKLYSVSERKRNTLEGFIDLLKPDTGSTIG